MKKSRIIKLYLFSHNAYGNIGINGDEYFLVPLPRYYPTSRIELVTPEQRELYLSRTQRRIDCGLYNNIIEVEITDNNIRIIE